MNNFPPVRVGNDNPVALSRFRCSDGQSLQVVRLVSHEMYHLQPVSASIRHLIRAELARGKGNASMHALRPMDATSE